MAKTLNSAQQDQLIEELKTVMGGYGITAFYAVIEIQEPNADIADFCCVIGGGTVTSPFLESMGMQTFEIIRKLSQVDLSQVTDN